MELNFLENLYFLLFNDKTDRRSQGGALDVLSEAAQNLLKKIPGYKIRVFFYYFLRNDIFLQQTQSSSFKTWAIWWLNNLRWALVAASPDPFFASFLWSWDKASNTIALVSIP